MRNNLPVTNVERSLKEGEFIVSKTNLKGQITYVNRPFLEISGFSEEELMGAPHNIVRHPDMPPAAFQDLWQTLQSGQPWRGMVKNRCKNGDYYWVDASANPIWERGRIVGFMSLREKPSREKIVSAERVYRQFREEGARGYSVKAGRVVRTGLFGWFESLANLSMMSRITAACITLGLLDSAMAASSLMTEAGISRNVFTLPVLASVLALVLLGWMWWYLRNELIRPLNEATRTCQTIASGGLSMNGNAADRRDEIGVFLHAINTMSGNLTSIVTDVRAASFELSSSTEELDATAQNVSQASSGQAANMEEASASIEQMSESIRHNTENAKVTDGMSSKAAKEAVEGSEAVKQTVAAMKQIAGKIGIIDDIAYQTNLLALNAAIEAARAGEYGKGFAVVAAEVRKLAERSQLASQEIGELASSSVQMAVKAGQLLDEMVPSINKTSGLVQEISAASEEQSSGVGQINNAMNQLNQITQQNASASEELAVTAEDMSGQARKLQQLMEFFQLHGRTGNTAVASVASKAMRNKMGKPDYAYSNT
jgi:aerotaxis receptor